MTRCTPPPPLGPARHDADHSPVVQSAGLRSTASAELCDGCRRSIPCSPTHGFLSAAQSRRPGEVDPTRGQAWRGNFLVVDPYARSTGDRLHKKTVGRGVPEQDHCGPEVRSRTTEIQCTTVYPSPATPSATARSFATGNRMLNESASPVHRAVNLDPAGRRDFKAGVHRLHQPPASRSTHPRAGAASGGSRPSGRAGYPNRRPAFPAPHMPRDT